MKTLEKVHGKIYERTSESNILKYICEEGDDISLWEYKTRGAERGTTEDMLSLGDEEEDEITFIDVDGEEIQTGLAVTENLEMPDGPWNYEDGEDPDSPFNMPKDGDITEDSSHIPDDSLDGGRGTAPMISEDAHSLIDDPDMEEWISLNTPLGEPVTRAEMEARYKSEHTYLD